MADRRPREYDSPRRRKKDSPSSVTQDALPRARAPYNPNPTELAGSYSSSSSSYIDISRTYSPQRSKGLAGILAFFTAPREHYGRPRRRRSRRVLRGANLSSSSINSDLAYGTGFVRRRKGDKAQGKRRERDTGVGREPRTAADPDAEILRIGAELAEVARRQNRSDMRDSRKLGGRPIVREDSGRGPGLESSRGLGSSKISNNPDEDGWESASDADSETSSVDSRLAYGGHAPSTGWGWGPSKPKRKDSVVDPKLFGPQNSLLGVVNEPVGFHDNMIDHSDLSDFAPPTVAQVQKAPRVQSSASATDSMQYVYPVPTSDPNKFDAGRSSAVSGQESYTSRPAPVPIQTAQVPIQQPQPMVPVSQSVYDPSYTVRSDPSIPTISGRTKSSVAGAALAGVAGAAIGASMISDRKDRDRRREDRDRYDDDRGKGRERRSDETEEERERRRERRRNETEEEREKRRAKRREEARDDPENDREKRRQERSDDRDDKRQEERRAERSHDGRDGKYWEDKYKQRRDDRYDDRPAKTPDTKVSPIDPFQFQVADDAFRTPDGTRNSDPITSIARARSPAIVTVERVPHWHREEANSTAEDKRMKPVDDDEENERGRSRERARTEREAESIYEETEHFTAPIEIGAVGAAVAAVTAEEKRRFKKRSREDRDDQRGRDTSKEQDPIQAEADRIYREAVLARKIAASKTDDDPVVRVVTPPEMAHKKQPSLYDAPNADFQLDKVMDPVEFMTSPIKGPGAHPSEYIFDDTLSSDLKRPLLTLVRPTPTPSPAPEMRKSKPRSKESSRDEEPGKSKEIEQTRGEKRNEKEDAPTQAARDAPSVGVETKSDGVQTPTSAGGTRNVTWGENETKHYEVETPYENRDDPIASSVRFSDVKEKPKMSPAKKASAWGAVRGAFISGAAAAVVANAAEASKEQKSAKPEDSRNGSTAPFEYRGVAVEPKISDRHVEERGPPTVGPKPLQSPSSKPSASHMPGAFEDDIDFTATLAAGLEDSGFDPNIVIKDPTYRRRSSPPGSNDDSPLKNYKQPFAETVSDLSRVPEDTSREKKTRDIGREDDYGSPSKLDKKSQKKRDKEAKRQSNETGALDMYQEAAAPNQVVEEPESYSEPSRSDKKDKKSKKSKKDSNGYDDDANGRSDKRVSVPIDAFDDLHSEITTKAAEEDEWATPKKSKKKSKRDSDRYDSPAISASEVTSSLEQSSSNKPKEKSKWDSDGFDSPSRSKSVSEVVSTTDQSSSKKSKQRSEQYAADSQPEDIPLPPPTVSEISKDDDDVYRKSKKSSMRDSSSFSDVADTRSVISEPARDDDYESRKSKKSSKRDSSSFSDVADNRSVKSSSTSKYEDDKSAKKEKKSGGFFGLFGSSKSDVKSDSKSDNRSEPDRSRDTEEDTDSKKKSKKSHKRRSTGDDSELYRTDSKRSSNGNDYETYDVDDGDPIKSTNGNGKHEKAGDKEESFLGNAGTLGAGVGIVAAAAIAAQHLQSKAARADEEERASERSAVEPVSKSRAPVFQESRDLPGQEIIHKQFSGKRAHEEFHLSEGPPFIDARDLSDEHIIEDNTFKTPSDHVVGPEEHSLREPRLMPREEIVDPEITEREFRVAIDPEWRDLLPLPPSNPGSPNNEPTLPLLALPESRPGTPPKESYPTRDRSSGSARRNDHPTPTKTPSRSAVPIKYILGNRSTPSSPGGHVRGPSATDPATKSPDTLMYPPKPRPRPTSWDSTKGLRTLSLLDPNRQEASSPSSDVSRQEVAVEELPNVAELDTNTSNRGISEERASNYAGDVVRTPSFMSSNKVAHESQSVPKTSVADPPNLADLPPLPETRPITPVKDERSEPLLAESHETLSKECSSLSELPPLPESRKPTPFEEDAHRDSSFFPGALATGAAVVLSTAAVSASSNHEEEDMVPEMASKSAIAEDLSTEFQVESITKDRSSYLFQATPPTKKFEELGIESPLAKKQRAPEEISSTSAKAALRDETFSGVPNASEIVAQEREAALEALNRPESDDDEPSAFTTPPESVKAVESEAYATDEFSYGKSTKGKKNKKRSEETYVDDEPSVEMLETPLADTAQEDITAEEFPIKKSKKDKKKQGIQLFPEDEPSLETIPAPEADAVEEFSIKKSKKDKKKGKKRGMDEKNVEEKPIFATDADPATADPTREAEYLDGFSPVSRVVELPLPTEERIEPPETLEEFSLKKSKKGKKKDKKKGLDTLETPEESSTIVPTAVEADSRALTPITEESHLLRSVEVEPQQHDDRGESSVMQSTNDIGLSLNDDLAQPLDDIVLAPQAQEAPEHDTFETEYPLKKAKKSKKKDKKKGLTQFDAEDEPSPVSELPSSVTTIPQEDEASDSFFSAISKRDKKKDKKKGKSLSDTPFPEAAAPVDSSLALEAEENAFSKARETPLPVSRALSEADFGTKVDSQEIGIDALALAPLLPVAATAVQSAYISDEQSLTPSKKDKKKDKKNRKGLSQSWTQEETAVPESSTSLETPGKDMSWPIESPHSLFTDPLERKAADEASYQAPVDEYILSRAAGIPLPIGSESDELDAKGNEGESQAVQAPPHMTTDVRDLRTKFMDEASRAAERPLPAPEDDGDLAVEPVDEQFEAPVIPVAVRSAPDDLASGVIDKRSMAPAEPLPISSEVKHIDEVLAAAQVPLPLTRGTDDLELNAQDEPLSTAPEPPFVATKANTFDTERSGDLSIAAQTPLPVASGDSEFDGDSRDIKVRPEDNIDSFENVSVPFSAKESKKGKKKGRKSVPAWDVDELSVSEPVVNEPRIEPKKSLAAQKDSDRESPLEFLPVEGSKKGKKKKGKPMQVWEAEESSVLEPVEGKPVEEIIQELPVTETLLSEGPTTLERTVDEDAIKAEGFPHIEDSSQIQALEPGFESYNNKDSKKGKKKNGKLTPTWEFKEETVVAPVQNEPVPEPVAREFTAEDVTERKELETENNEIARASEPIFEEFNIKGSKKTKKKKGKLAEFWEPENSAAPELIGNEPVEKLGKRESLAEDIVQQDNEIKIEDPQAVVKAGNQDATDSIENPSEMFGVIEPKKSKKKKNRSAEAWELDDTPSSELIQEKPSTAEPIKVPVAENILNREAVPVGDDVNQAADPVFDSYDMKVSKKSKKKQAKSLDTGIEDEVSSSLPIAIPVSEPPTETPSEREDFSGFSTPTSKGKGKKKQKRKSVAWDTEEPEKEPTLDSSRTLLPISSGDDVLHASQSAEEIHNVPRIGSEEPMVISEAPKGDEVLHEVKNSKPLQKEKALAQVHAPTADKIPVTPLASEGFATAQTDFSSSDYFPSTASLHSPWTHRDMDDKKAYFPSAVSILPAVAAGTVIAAESVVSKAHKESKSTSEDILQPNSRSHEATEKLEEGTLAKDSDVEPSVNAANTLTQETVDIYVQHSSNPNVSAIPETEVPMTAPKVSSTDRSLSLNLHWPATTATKEETSVNKDSRPSTTALAHLDAQSPAVDAGQEHRNEPLVKELQPSYEPVELHLSAADPTALKFEDPVIEQRSIAEEEAEQVDEAEHVNTNLPPLYSEEQLESARQMNAEFGLGRKKSKKNKKGRASALEDDIPAQVPEEQEEPGLLGRETGDAETPSEPRTADGLALGYKDDQLSIAKQLQAEFEAGTKKSKKNKKGRAGLSRASTQDEDFPTQSLENKRDAETLPEDTNETREAETAPETQTPDGLAAGYKEDQLSLAKQLQAEFEAGAKKSKKGKNSRSTSRTPNQEYEPSSSYIEETQTTQPEEAQVANRDFLPGDEEAKHTRSPDGLAAGFTPDQLELARQMREEFSSGSKKSKKDKKRQSLIRSTTEDNFYTGDAGSEDVSLGTTEVDSATDSPHPLSQVATPEEFDSFSTKKGKKDKKRQSLLRSGTQDSEGPAESTRDRSVQPGARQVDFSEKDLEMIAEPAIDPLADPDSKQPTLPEEAENFLFTKKGKKDSKKKQSLLKSDALDNEGFVAPTGDGSVDTVMRHLETSQVNDDKIGHPTIDPLAATEDKSASSQHDDFDDFAFITKKGKKGNKKRQSLVQSTMQVEEPSTTSAAYFVEHEPAEQVREMDWTHPATTEAVAADPNFEAKFVPIITDEPETFQLISKKAKKGNKKGQSPATSTNEDEGASASRSNNLFDRKAAREDVDENDISRDTTVAAELSQPTSDKRLATSNDDIESFTFATKKDKKGKKKRQSGLSTPAQEEEPVPKPISTVTDTEAHQEGASEFDETQVTNASFDPEIADLEAELNFSTKRSKKDKKGKKSKANSGTITPQTTEALMGYQDQGKEKALGDGSLADRIWAEVMPAESTQPADTSRFPERFQDPVELYRMENLAQGDQIIVPTEKPRDVLSSWTDEVAEAKTAHSHDQHIVTHDDPSYIHTETKPSLVHKQDLAQDYFTEEDLTAREVLPDEHTFTDSHEEAPSRVVQNDSAFNIEKHADVNDDKPAQNEKDNDRIADVASAGLVATSTALLAGVLVHDKKSKLEDTEATSRESGLFEPKKNINSKGQAKVIDRKSATEEEFLDDPLLWEGVETQKFGEHDDKNESQVEREMGENGPGESHKRERTASMDVWQPASIVEHPKTPRKHEYEDVPAAIERDINLEQEKIEDEAQQTKEQKAEKSLNEVSEEFFTKSAKKSKKNKKQTPEITWDTQAEQENESSTTTEKDGQLFKGFEEAPTRQKSKKNKKQSRLAAWDVLIEPEEDRIKDPLPTKNTEALSAEVSGGVRAQEAVASAIHAVDEDASDDRYRNYEEHGKYREVDDFSQINSKPNKDISVERNRSQEVYISPPSSPVMMEGEAKKGRGLDEHGIGPEKGALGDNIRKKHRGQEVYLPPVLEEDNVEQPELIKGSRTPERTVRERGIDDTNRDSALVTESPIPFQRRFGDDHEYSRDSGVHLGDTPHSKARSPIISTDDALARMSWPAVDEESETVDLKRSQRTNAEKSINSHAGVAAIAAASSLGAAELISQANRTSRRSKDTHLEPTKGGRSDSPNFNRLQTPEHAKYRPSSAGSNQSSNLSSGTPLLRRSDRKLSGDLRSLSQRSEANLAKHVKDAKEAERSPATSNVSLNPVANEGRVRVKDMADVYDGYGEGRIGSPMSPTRPHSMRRRQSMQVLDLEARVEQLAAENRMLAEAKNHAEHSLHAAQRATLALADRDAEVDTLKQQLEWLHREVERLKEVNDGLTSANITLGNQHNERYGALEAQHSQSTRELEDIRQVHGNLSAGTEAIITEQVLAATQERDREIAQLRQDLETAQERIKELQREILDTKSPDGDFLVFRDEDYFDNACQQLCQHVQQWVLRFSKFSDMRACRLTSEINNDKIIDRLDNAILDGSDVDEYLKDRVKRRDVFMSMTMTMIWEFVFTRYLFGMDREQRQKLKTLEKTLSEVGPPSAVHRWRATTLTLLSKRNAFIQQREQDTEAVVQVIFQTLSDILPPPSQLENQIQEQLKRVMRAAIDLSIEMRTQCAEYMMLPPLRPEYDANGDLAREVQFNAALMNERSGDTVSNEELEAQGAVVRIVLFPLVVKKGDDSGDGEDEIVVCPAQVMVAKLKRQSRHVTPEVMGQNANHSRMSLQSSMAVEQVPDI